MLLSPEHPENVRPFCWSRPRGSLNRGSGGGGGGSCTKKGRERETGRERDLSTGGLVYVWPDLRQFSEKGHISVEI